MYLVSEDQEADSHRHLPMPNPRHMRVVVEYDLPAHPEDYESGCGDALELPKYILDDYLDTPEGQQEAVIDYLYADPIGAFCGMVIKEIEQPS